MKFTSKYNLFHGIIGFLILVLPQVGAGAIRAYSDSRYPEFEVNPDVFKRAAYDEYYVGIIGAVILLLVLAVAWYFLMKKLSDDELYEMPVAYLVPFSLGVGIPALLSMALLLFSGIVMEVYEPFLYFIGMIASLPGIELSYIGALPVYMLVAWLVGVRRKK